MGNQMDLNEFQASPGDVAAHYVRVIDMQPKPLKPSQKIATVKAKLDLPRPNKGEGFIKGPIPFQWMRIATQCGGRGAEVGLLLWYAAGWQRKNPVKLTAAICKQLGVHPKTVKRVLTQMEAARLVKAVFRRGRSPMVTLLRPEVAVDED